VLNWALVNFVPVSALVVLESLMREGPGLEFKCPKVTSAREAGEV
jgi:hypothetical protein